jgi:photosystem II stability/assembly factor-like uncharacterized protein
MPRSRPPFPWILGPVAIGLVTLAFRSSTVRAPDPAPQGRLEWTALKAGTSQKRGPNGVGVYLQDVLVRPDFMLAVAPRRQFASTDQGLTWQERTDLDGAQRLATDRNVVLAITSENGFLHRSSDGGRTWTRVDDDALRLQRGVALTGNVAFVVGINTLLRSVDTGKTWTKIPVPRLTLQSVSVRGPVVLVVGSGGYVRRSTDLGVTWTERWLPSYDMPLDVAFADDSTVVLVGTRGAIFRSRDAGATWTEVSSPTRQMLRSVAFADARTGLAVGWWGEAVHTTDGGETWTRERTGTNAHLFRVTAHPSGGFVATGIRETILRARP